MLEGLRWRILAATATAEALGFAVFAGLLAATGTAQPDRPLIYVLALTAAVLGAQVASRLVVAPTRRSLRAVVDWVRALGQDGAQPTIELDADFGDLATALRESARTVSDELTLLQIERARLSVALEHMESGVILLDRGYRIILINPAAARLLGTSVRAAEWRSLIETARDHELVAVARACLSDDQAVQGGEPTVIQLGDPPRLVQVGGSSIPGLTSSSPGGRLDAPGVLLLLQDVTQLRQAVVMRQEFVANVSHELRTPLAGLKAVAETLQAGALEDSAVARGFLDRILVEVDRLTDLVVELLELAHLESGEREIARESLDVSDLVSRAAERLAPQAQEAGIRLQIDESGEPLFVLGDELRLERVFINLLENAIKYSPPGSEVETSFTCADGEVIVTIKDAGQGIPEQDLPRIFERFYKSDRARSSPGSGLGLAIVKHAVQAHGGHVWAESIDGKGSTFFVSLPLARRSVDRAES
ncbi:MAG TPA: ATP-binding protein [Chloroflexota bacterium]